jgi:tetratricopeptide (TPR) repeat protein
MAPELEPYIGPRSFRHEDSASFFGRDREVSELQSLVVAHRVVLLYSQSGVGKSSLLNARLIPSLEEQGFDVLPIVRVGGLPVQVATDSVNPYVRNTLLGWSASDKTSQSRERQSLAEFLRARRAARPDTVDVPYLAVFDQFEELFTRSPAHRDAKAEFFRQMAEALAGNPESGQEADPLLRILVSIREEYLGQLDPVCELIPGRFRTRYRLERLGETAALAAVTGPLARTPVRFAPGVAERLVANLMEVRVEAPAGGAEICKGDSVEPVQLQVVCQSMWRDLPSGVLTITDEHLQKSADVDRVLSDFYERAVERAARQGHVSHAKLRKWFEHSLITPAGTRGLAYKPRAGVPGIPLRATDILESDYVIRAEMRAGARWYELTHDRLIDPIRRSNREWRTRRRRLLRAAAGFVMIVLLLWGAAFRARNQRLTGQLESQRREAEAARKEAEAAKENESRADKHILAGNQLAAYGDQPGALREFSYAVRLNPSSGFAHAVLGQAYADLGNPVDAYAEFVDALNVDPRVWPAHLGLARAYRDLGLYDIAGLEYEAAAQSGAQVTLFERATRYYFDTDNLAAALADLAALADNRNNLDWQAEAAWGRAIIARRIGRYTDALALGEKAVMLEPKNTRWRSSLAYTYALVGQITPAWNHLRIVLNASPTSFPANMDAGRLEFLSGHSSSARNYFARALRQPQIRAHPWARIRRAICQVALGNTETGLREVDAALSGPELPSGALRAVLQEASFLQTGPTSRAGGAVLIQKLEVALSKSEARCRSGQPPGTSS